MENECCRQKKSFVVVGCKPWNRSVFRNKISQYAGKWFFISNPKELTPTRLNKISPEYIFFLHWSWKVSRKIIEGYRCICFHMTDVPYGRGGSPLQNLIIRGKRKTKLTALRMTNALDAGPVYIKNWLSLKGSAEEIYKRADNQSADLILKIIENQINPKPQKGRIVIFKRRKPEESEIRAPQNIRKLYDFIRMLDAPSYPRAFIKYKGFVFEFSEPRLYHNEIFSRVKIKK
jgi:methionyl-tRNA formyltransferase